MTAVIGVYCTDQILYSGNYMMRRRSQRRYASSVTMERSAIVMTYTTLS
jgi:hypothetical protein